MRVFTIDFTTFTNGANMSVNDSGVISVDLGSSQEPLNAFLSFSRKEGHPGMVVVKHFRNDQKAEAIKDKLKAGGYNVQEFIVGG